MKTLLSCLTLGIALLTIAPLHAESAVEGLTPQMM